MKKILVLFVAFICFILPAFADENAVLPSESGVVLSVENIYSDNNSEQQGTQQIAKVKIL